MILLLAQLCMSFEMTQQRLCFKTTENLHFLEVMDLENWGVHCSQQQI